MRIEYAPDNTFTFTELDELYAIRRCAWKEIQAWEEKQ